MAQDQGAGGNTPVLSEWVGYGVFISYLSGPSIDPEKPAEMVTAQTEASTASFQLDSYGPLGIEVRRSPNDPVVFMPWGGVLYVQGPPPEVREEIDKQMAEGGEEEGPQG
jgi:hypothetical protein